MVTKLIPNGQGMLSGAPGGPTFPFKSIMVAFWGPSWHPFRFNFELVFRAVLAKTPGASPNRFWSKPCPFLTPFGDPFWNLFGTVSPQTNM